MQSRNARGGGSHFVIHEIENSALYRLISRTSETLLSRTLDGMIYVVFGDARHLQFSAHGMRLARPHRGQLHLSGFDGASTHIFAKSIGTTASGGAVWCLIGLVVILPAMPGLPQLRHRPGLSWCAGIMISLNQEAGLQAGCARGRGCRNRAGPCARPSAARHCRRWSEPGWPGVSGAGQESGGSG